MPVVAWFDESGGDDGEIFVRRFQPQPACYALNLDHTGNGDGPTAAPANSTGCPVGQYTAGQSIALTASPASGWHIDRWTGTANDNSTSTSNTVTMPAANHLVSVAYEEDTATGYWVYFPVTLDVAPSSRPGGVK